MQRRTFMTRGAMAAVALAIPPIAGASPRPAAASASSARFKLKYAPSLGQFKNLAGPDIAGQIQFIADQGFTAIFDNGIMNRPAAEQDLIVRELRPAGPGDRPVRALRGLLGEELREARRRDADDAAAEDAAGPRHDGADRDASRRWSCPAATTRAWRGTTRRPTSSTTCAPAWRSAQPKGLVIVLEPLNPKNHPGLFLTKIPQAFAICRAVNSPSCKILNDMYHQQITEGNLIPNIEAAWNEIAAFHIGDNPGRNEPTSGEINYRNIFKWIHAKGYEGVLCMEHGQSKPGRDGEQAVIDAYRACDQF